MIDELLGNSFAAQVLHEQIATKTTEQWMLWLQNNRNQSRRVPYRIPFVRLAGGVFYHREEIANFAEWEKARSLGSIKLTGRAAEVLHAYGVGTTSGSATGRKLLVQGITTQVDQVTGAPYIQFITDDPLMVYRLEADEARAVTKNLNDAIRRCEKVRAGGSNEDNPSVETSLSRHRARETKPKVK